MGSVRRILLVAAWVAATFATALVAWSAVRIAGDQVGERPVEPLSAAEVAALPAPATSPAPTFPASTVTTAATPVAVGGDQLAGPGASPAGPTTTGPERPATTTTETSPRPSSTTTTAPATPAGTTSTSAPSSPSSTTAATTSSTTTTRTTSTTTAAAPATRGYQLRGGSVVIEYVPGRVTLKSASPKAGYQMEIHDRGPDEVEVRFESGNGDSRFEAHWSGGRLVVDIDED